jgi:hypothetical protein
MRPPCPNLVPLLDVMFVVLFFLMLVTDLDPRSQEALRLPEATQFRECWSSARGTPLAINVHHRDDRACGPYAHARPCGIDEHWWITVDGRECTDPAYLRTVLVQEIVRGNLGGSFPRNRRVDLRSDASAPSGLAQRAMNACALLGIERVHAAARRPRNR